MDLNLVYGFQALWQLRSVSLAAGQLNVSQPTMSGILARLRKVFDDQLFMWDGTTMNATAKAEALAPLVRKIIDDAESLQSLGGQADINVERTVVIAAGDYLIPTLAHQLRHRLEREAPRLRLSFIPTHAKLHRPKERAGVSLIVIPHGAIHDLEFMRKTVYRDRLVFVGPRKPFEKQRQLNEADFFATEHVTFSVHPSAVQNHFTAVSSTLQQRLSGRLVFQNFSLLLNYLAVAEHRCLAVVPARAVLYSPVKDALAIFDPPVAMPNYEMGLYWNASDTDDLVMRWSRDAICEALAAPA